MSTTTLKHHFNTLAFLPRQKGRRIVKSLRSLKIRTSRRRLKQALRQLVDRRALTTPSYA